ncbi:MAG: aminotransferase class IV [Phycisphaerae bacterium]|nr:aminotransferase class IV [Phycisphaerae bacterium]
MTATTASPTVWLNGRLVDERSASVSVFDRGFLFGDGVYELIRFFRCAPGARSRRHGVAMDLHVARLHRSLGLARIVGFDANTLPRICDELLDANNLDDASVYLQVTRGAGPSRAHIPQAGLAPTVFACASACEPIERFAEPQTVRAVVREDLRWALCQIKTISLMGNILSLIDADEHGASEAILHRDGIVSEGAYTNVFVVRGEELVTPPVDDDPPILHGVTRADILELAPGVESRAGTGRPLRAIVRPITVEELRGADEILITSSRRFVSAVTSLDGEPIGDGRAGPVAHAVFHALRNGVARATGITLPAAESAHPNPALSNRR